MGYCPYFCICCGTIVDNGWGSCDVPYHRRVDITTRRIGKKNCKYLNYKKYDRIYYEINDPYHPATEDVCNECFIKDKPIKQKRSKEERREYWRNHCKKNK